MAFCIQCVLVKDRGRKFKTVIFFLLQYTLYTKFVSFQDPVTERGLVMSLFLHIYTQIIVSLNYRHDKAGFCLVDLDIKNLSDTNMTFGIQFVSAKDCGRKLKTVLFCLLQYTLKHRPYYFRTSSLDRS